MHPSLKLPLERLPAFCRQNAIRELAIFGSATRQDFKPESSDLDVLVEFRPDFKIGLFQFFAIQEELEALFQRKVDLVSKRGLNRHIESEVLSSREVLYAE